MNPPRSVLLGLALVGLTLASWAAGAGLARAMIPADYTWYHPMWPDLMPAPMGNGHLTYSVCTSTSSHPFTPAGWIDAVENWDVAMSDLMDFDNVVECDDDVQVKLRWGEDMQTDCNNPLEDIPACARFTDISHGDPGWATEAVIYFDYDTYADFASWRTAIAAHEWGHILGLADHNCESQCDTQLLMATYNYITDPPCLSGPSPREVERVLQYYGYHEPYNPDVGITACHNPFDGPGDPVTIEIYVDDPDSDLALVQYLVEGNGGFPWSHLLPGVSPTCTSSYCRTTLTLDDLTKSDWTYGITAAAYDEAGHRSVFCTHNCPDNDVGIGANNWYHLRTGSGSGSSPPVQAHQSVAAYLQQPTASTGDTVSVNLDWTDTEGEQSFTIQKKVGTGLFADFETVSAGVTDYSDSLPPSQEGETLTYRVRATFPDTSYNLSNEPSIDAPTSPGDPTSSPLDATIYCTGWGEIGIFTPWAWLEWDAKAGYTGQYKVQHRESGGSWATQLTGGTDFKIALDNNSTYQFKVLLADSTPWTGTETRSVSCEDPEPPEPGSGNLTGSSYCDPHVGLEHRVVVSLDWDEYLPDKWYCVEMTYPGMDWIYATVECTDNPWLTTKYDHTGYIRDNTETAWQVVVPDIGGDIWWGGPIYITTPSCKADVVDLSLQVLSTDGSSRIEPGESVEAKIWLKNNSDKIASVGAGNPFKINLWADRAVAPSFGDYDHDAQAETILAPYEEKQFTISFTAPATVGSNKRAWVLADGYDQVMEILEDNNRLAAYYTVSAPPAPCDSFGDVDDDGYVTYLDIDKILEFIAEDPPPTPEQKLRADIDGDGEVTQADIDGITDYLDGLAYTVPVCEDLDDDGLPNYQDDDDDNDGFTDAAELYIGTDPLDDCPTWTGTPGLCPGPTCDGHDAWPPDLNVDTVINVLDLFQFVLADVLGCTVGDPCYDARFDLNADETINVLDTFALVPILGTQCSP